MPPKHTLEVELGSKIFVRKYFARQIDLDPHSRPKPTTLVQSPENRRTSKVSPKDFRSRRAHGRELRTSILQKTLSFQIRKVTIFGTRHARQQIVARGKVGRLAERRAAGRANRAAAHLRWWTRLLRSCRAGHERDTLPFTSQPTYTTPECQAGSAGTNKSSGKQSCASEARASTS